MKWAFLVVGGLVIALVFAAGGGGGSWPHGLASDAQERVRRSLRDPASAEFRNVRVVPGSSEGVAAACGQVNSRNGFGGMSGWQDFIVEGRRGDNNSILVGPPMLQEANRASFNELWGRLCRS